MLLPRIRSISNLRVTLECHKSPKHGVDISQVIYLSLPCIINRIICNPVTASPLNIPLFEGLAPNRATHTVGTACLRNGITDKLCPWVLFPVIFILSEFVLTLRNPALFFFTNYYCCHKFV